MSKAKRLKWLTEHNRKCRQRQASRDGDFIVRSQGHFLTYQRINGAKPPPMRNGLPFIMIDDERIIVEKRKTLRDFLDNSDFSSDMRLTSEYLNEVLKSLIGETTTPTSPHS